jgi:hypothetical protein
LAGADDAERCSRCNTHIDDWTVIVDGRRRDLRQPKWDIEIKACPGCEQIAARQSEIPEENRRHLIVRLREHLPDDDEDFAG